MRGIAFCAALLLAAAWAVSSPAQQTPAARGPAPGVEIHGLAHLSLETVADIIDLPDGPASSELEVVAALRRLKLSRLFVDGIVRIYVDRIVFALHERARVEDISFEGFEAIDPEEFRDALAVRPGAVFDPDAAQRDRQGFASLYRSRGRPAFNLTIVPTQLPGRRVSLVYRAEEGPMARVEEIRFPGAEAIPECRLRRVISIRRNTWEGVTDAVALMGFEKVETMRRFLDLLVLLPGLREVASAPVPFNLDGMAFEAQSLRDFYLDRGHVDMRVLSARAVPRPDGLIHNLTFEIEEGPVYAIGEVGLSAPDGAFDPADFAGARLPASGAIYAPGRITAGMDALGARATELGLPFLSVRPAMSRDERARVVDVDFQLLRGPEIYLERIDFEGNEKTEDAALRRLVPIEDDAPLDARVLRLAALRMERLEHVTSAQVSIAEGSSTDRAVATFALEEDVSGLFSFGATYTAVNGPGVEATYADTSFMRQAVRVVLRGRLSAWGVDMEASLAQPHWLGPDQPGKWGLSFVTAESGSLIDPLDGFKLVVWSGSNRIDLPLVLLIALSAALYCHLWAHDPTRVHRRWRRASRQVAALLILQFAVVGLGWTSSQIVSIAARTAAPEAVQAGYDALDACAGETDAADLDA